MVHKKSYFNIKKRNIFFTYKNFRSHNFILIYSLVEIFYLNIYKIFF